MVAYVVPVYFAPPMETLVLIPRERHLIYVLFFACSFLIFGEMLGASDRRIIKLSLRHLLLHLLSAVLASIILILVVWLFEYNFVGRRAILKILFFTGALGFVFAYFFSLLAQRYRSRVCFLLEPAKQSRIKRALLSQENAFEWIEGDEDLMNGARIVELCRERGVDFLVVENSLISSDLDLISLLEVGTRVIGGADFWERFMEKIPPKEVDQAWLTRMDLRMKNPFVHLSKRCMDVAIAVVALVTLLPLLLLSLLLILVETGFPLFFVQERTGLMGKTYSMYKLRTMRKDAEGEGAKWAGRKDSRVTFFGKFLRKWRIDEIPQFWNVIRGEMSVVGPRPERPEFQEKLSGQVPHWNSRHLVKPGLTGWAQIRFSYASDLEESEEKLAYDLFYLKNASMALDLEIILSTLRSISRGSR